MSIFFPISPYINSYVYVFIYAALSNLCREKRAIQWFQIKALLLVSAFHKCSSGLQ